ncbi:MAG: hypothetical protein J6A79_10695 [Clostridia bacterium]|nr:hypothetical protein [Clostridia bacterium]
MTDLWPEIQPKTIEENNSVGILREQAKIISKKTEGKIKGTFSKVTYKKNGLTELSRAMSALPLSGNLVEEDDDKELKGKTDANKLYDLERYKFEIYSDKYRFRIFTLDNRSVFPVYINIDEGICEELEFDRREEIASNRELEDMVSSVFNSKKLQTIISRMLIAPEQ